MNGIIGTYEKTLTNHVSGGNKTACWLYLQNDQSRLLWWVVVYDLLGSALAAECFVDDYGTLVSKRKIGVM